MTLDDFSASIAVTLRHTQDVFWAAGLVCGHEAAGVTVYNDPTRGAVRADRCECGVVLPTENAVVHRAEHAVAWLVRQGIAPAGTAPFLVAMLLDHQDGLWADALMVAEAMAC